MAAEVRVRPRRHHRPGGPKVLVSCPARSGPARLQYHAAVTTSAELCSRCRADVHELQHWPIIRGRNRPLEGKSMQFRRTHSSSSRPMRCCVTLVAVLTSALAAAAAPAPVAGIPGHIYRRSGAVPGAAVALHRAVSRRTGAGRHRGRRRPHDLLFWCGRGRCMEEHGRGRHLVAADRSDPHLLRRRPRGGCLRSQCHLRRDRRGRTARGHDLRRRRLQVGRRRQDLDPYRAEGQPPDRRAHRRPDRCEHRAGRSLRARLWSEH